MGIQCCSHCSRGGLGVRRGKEERVVQASATSTVDPRLLVGAEDHRREPAQVPHRARGLASKLPTAERQPQSPKQADRCRCALTEAAFPGSLQLESGGETAEK